MRKAHLRPLHVLVESVDSHMPNVYHGLDEFFNKITIQSSTPIQSGQWLEIAQYQIQKEGNHAKI